MQLLFLTPQLPHPPRQGTTIRNFNLIRELVRAHTIDLLTFLAPGEELTPDNILHDLCRNVAAVEQPARDLLQRGRDTVLRLAPDMGLRLASPAMHALVDAWTRRTRYDVVQAEGIEMAQYGLRVAGKAHGAGAPALVFDDHNCEYLLQQRNAFTDLRQPRRWVAAAYSLVQWRKLRRYERAILDAADATVAVSAADRGALLTLAPNAKIDVISNGIDLSLYRPAPDRSPATPPALVFTGKMDYRPNVDAVLWFAREVLPLVTQEAPDVRFQIVGMNPHPRLGELRGRPDVEITGAVADTRPYIHGCAAYVIPMRIGGGTRFKALEAMACGVPIVTTTLGVEGIQVRDAQELLLADDPEAFARQVLRLLADLRMRGELRRHLGLAARTFVEQHYGWERIVPQLNLVYDQAVRSNESKKGASS